MKSEFYIGYLDRAPEKLRKWLRRIVPTIIVVGIALGAYLALSQKGFPPGTFELGKLTQMTGFVEMNPIPMLRLEKSNGYENILLIGFGKFGADSTLVEMERFHKMRFDENIVTLEGTRIQLGDMKLLELTEKKFSLVNFESGSPSVKLQKNLIDQQSRPGEVIDPKCYFGVMKPGEGKTHRSCAIRCISGGIPPVLKTGNEDDLSYVFILDEDGQSCQSDWAPLAGLKNTVVTGNVYDWNGWQVMYANEPIVK